MAVQTKLQVRRDTAANWTSTNPTLASGEIGFETDTLKFKIGNGSTAWNSLAYQNASTSADNYAQTLGTKTLVLSGATTPYTIVSVTITTNGSPVLVMVSGDAENVTAGTWCRLQLYRGTTAIGNDVQLEGSAASENSAYALQFVDAQAAGTYTYNLKLTSIAGGNFNFGENTGPVITVVELNSLAGSANLASNLASGAAGSLPYQSAANTTTFLARTATNNQVLTFDSSTNAPYWSTPSSTFNGGTITNALTVSNTSGVNTSGTFTSTIATGTAPFTVSSTTRVANLNVATSGYVVNTATGTNSADLVYGNMADNDQFRIRIGGTATNAGFVELATADDGTEPIYVRQYTGVFTTLARTATILDGSGNTLFPGSVTAPSFTSNVATGTAPFTVTSTTQVANLNVAISGSTSNVLGGATGGVLYQSAANTTTSLAAAATNNSILSYNTGTSAPAWQTPPQAMATLIGYTSTVTAAGYTSLTNASTHYQQFTGTSTQTVVLPNALTLTTGWTYHIVNNSTANVTANTFANAATVITIPANTTAMVTCIDITVNTAAAWESGLTDFSTYVGTGSVVLSPSDTSGALKYLTENYR